MRLLKLSSKLCYQCQETKHVTVCAYGGLIRILRMRYEAVL